MRYAWISWFAAAVGFLASVPVLSDNPYTLHVLSLVGIYAIVAMGLNLVFGYTGQISLGHAAYFAVGAYTSGIVTLQLGAPFAVGMIAAVALAMATIGFGEIVKMLLVNWEPVTGGPAGISRIPHPGMLGFTFNTADAKFY